MDWKRLWQRSLRRVRELGQRVEDAVWPDGIRCISCGDGVSTGELLCRACEAELTDLEKEKDPPPAICPDAVSLWRHDGVARRLIHQLKLEGDAGAGEIIGEKLAERAMTMALPPETVITWVTMPPSRLKERPCDHGRIIAEQMARGTGFPARQLLIRASREHEQTQRGLNLAQRLVNVKGLFTAEPLHGETVLLIDDVMTSGATCAECAGALMAAGAGRVMILTASRACKRKPGEDDAEDGGFDDV